MKRILVLLSVVAMMALMMVVTVAPVFAAKPGSHPTPAANQAYVIPPVGDEVTTCAVDPWCTFADVGAHHFDEGFGFPHGQSIAFGQ
jgi:hypothetical protein